MASIRLPKRLFDLLGALAGLIAFSPALAIIAISILLEDGGPVLFHQERLGRRRRPFTILKFRSMRDGRITRVGRWLRRSGLDELPQLINVLLGEMSLIGPRPELPFIVEQYESWQFARHEVKPGITGWWQIHHRNDVPLHQNLDYDIYYLRNMSSSLDLTIAWRTLKIMASGALRASGRDRSPTKRAASR